MCTKNYSYRLLLLLFINMCIYSDNCNTIVEFKVVLLYTIIILRYKEGHDLNNLKDQCRLNGSSVLGLSVFFKYVILFAQTFLMAAEVRRDIRKIQMSVLNIHAFFTDLPFLLIHKSHD